MEHACGCECLLWVKETRRESERNKKEKFGLPTRRLRRAPLPERSYVLLWFFTICDSLPAHLLGDPLPTARVPQFLENSQEICGQGRQYYYETNFPLDKRIA